MNTETTLFCAGANDLQFARFLRDYVTSSFPGFTIRTGVGYWEGKPEPTREIVICHDGSGSFEYIAQAYCARFSQTSVLVTHRTIVGEFLP